MKIWVYFVSLFVLVAVIPAAVKRKHPVAAKKSVTSRAKPVKKSSGRKTSASRNPAPRRRSVAAVRQPSRTPPHQAVPSSDRYREIQESLASKGYLKTAPNGVWDQNAQDALRKFQTDQQLSVTGRLSSRSIIALGLGSPTSAVQPAPSPQALPPRP